MVLQTYLEKLSLNNFEIRKSPIHGNGCFSSKNFEKGDFINYHFTPDGITQFGRFLNHSYKPTVISKKGEDGFDYVFALKDINQGDEFTLDYRNRPDLEQPLQDWF